MRKPHHAPGGRFRNPWPSAEPHGFGGLWRWTAQRLVKRLRADPPRSRFERLTPNIRTPQGSAGTLSVTWVGHATTLLQLGGINVLTDPVWSDRASPVAFAGPRRWVPPGMPLDALPSIDAVVISHNHYDHLDAPTVRAVAHRWPRASWFVPLGLGPWLRDHGVTAPSELDWWNDGAAGDLQLTCVPAQHFSARSPWDRDRTLWCGWVLSSGSRAVYFAGDTGYHPDFGTIASERGPFDLTLLPVGAYEPRWFMRPVHMNPEEAVQAYRDLAEAAGAGILMPVHWGTFKLTDEPMDEPPHRTRVAWQAASLPSELLWVPRHGETRAIRANGSRDGNAREHD